MEINEAIETLEDYNRWRRARPPYDKETPPEKNTQPNPEKVGRAIDRVVEQVRLEKIYRLAMTKQIEAAWQLIDSQSQTQKALLRKLIDLGEGDE